MIETFLLLFKFGLAAVLAFLGVMFVCCVGIFVIYLIAVVITYFKDRKNENNDKA